MNRPPMKLFDEDAMSLNRLSLPLAVAGVFLLVGCSSAPKPVDMSKTYIISDDEGHPAGKVIFNPMGTGKVYDYSGALIGNIVPPADAAPPR
ncbi:MAG: hypothetical protein F8N37_05955 [Telmatospirillum sp.]|nr:hypothetical protein [Telmatospirillum sp.]